MLPFLKNKRQESSLIINTRKPDEGAQDEKPESNEALEACAKDLIDAIHSRNVQAVAEALKAAIECADSSEPMDDEDEQEPKQEGQL